MTGRLQVGLLLATGVAAAFQVGKVAPIIDVLGDTFHADVGTLAWLSSTISVVGATLGLVIGISIGRIGYGVALTVGLLLMAIGCLLGSFSTSIAYFLAARIVEGVAYIAVFVSTPSLIFHVAGTQARSALALWASAVPVGIVLAMLAVPYFHTTLGWRVTWQVLAVCFFFLAATHHLLRKSYPAGSAEIRIKRQELANALTAPSVLRLAWCFFAYAGIWFIFVTWTPYLLRVMKADSWLSIPLFSALVVAANIGGNLAGSFLISRGTGVARLLIVAFAGDLLASLYLMQGMTDPIVIVAAATLASLISGVLPPATMAAIGMEAKIPRDVAIGNAFVMQSSNAAALLMPPLFGFLYASFQSTQPAVALITILAVSGLLVGSQYKRA